MTIPRRVAILGAGTIGSEWAALFAAHGTHVRIVDPDPVAAHRAESALKCAHALGVGGSARGAIRYGTDLAAAVDGVDWVQESLPESLALKRGALAALDAVLPAHTIVASSTSSLTASDLASGRPYADRIFIAHPLQPVYAIRVVELSAGENTSSQTMERAASVMRALGREPIVVRGDVPGLVSNRLTAALLREAFDLIARGVIGAAELDRLVSHGIAAGWVAAGPLGTEAIGAGAGGFPALLETLEEPMSRLWRSLAAWHRLESPVREALAEKVGKTATTQWTADCAWARILARIQCAAEEA